MQILEPNEDAALNLMIQKRDVYHMCKYFFDFELTPNQEKIVSVVAFDGYWMGKEWVVAKRASICCATRYGKSRCMEMGALLWIMLNPGKKLRIIAPTGTKTSIIREYMIEHILHSSYFTWLLDLDKKGQDRIKKAVNKQRMTWKNQVDLRTLSADKATKGESLMGWGGNKILVEEAGEIPAEVWPKIQRMMLDDPDASYAEIGNPWNRDGFFWQHWINPDWVQIHIDYIIGIEEGRYTEAQIKEIQEDPQVTPMEFQVLYKAEFPDESSDQLIPYKSIQNAIREVPKNLKQSDDSRFGADIAELGEDFTVFIYGRRFGKLIVVDGAEHYAKKEIDETIANIVKTYDRVTPQFNRMVPDSTGMGTGVYAQLKRLKAEGRIANHTKIIKFQSAKKPRTKKKQQQFKNIKSQAYFYLREKFVTNNLIIPPHIAKKYPVLIDQLNKMKHTLTTDGKKWVRDPGELPDDTAEKKSPDFADALCYMVWDQEKIGVTV